MKNGAVTIKTIVLLVIVRMPILRGLRFAVWCFMA